MSTERPILFSGPMVRAILDSKKTQTRRIAPIKSLVIQQDKDGCPSLVISLTKRIKGALESSSRGGCHVTREEILGTWASQFCPYGKPGDRLWVRETCCARELSNGIDGVYYHADDSFEPIENSKAAADRWVDLNHYRYFAKHATSKKRGMTVPPIHMPRWASRITLEITDVRIERLHEITEADAKAEGFVSMADVKRNAAWSERGDFANLWDKLNAKRGFGWDANPWVWVVSFKRLSPAVNPQSKIENPKLEAQAV